MTATNSDKSVSASDVEKYCYCPLSWWLSEQNREENSIELNKGIDDHAHIGKDVKKIKSTEKVSQESERSLLWFSLIAIIICINGMAIFYTIYTPSQQGETIMTFLSIIAVIWVIVAALFFYIGIKMEKKTKLSKDQSRTQKTTSLGKNIGSSGRDTSLQKRFLEAKLNTLLFFLVSGILAINGLLIFFSIGQENADLFSRIFIVLSLIWLFGSTFFYFTSVKIESTPKEEGKLTFEKKGKRSFTDSEISVALFGIVATILALNSLTIYQNPHTNIGWIIFILAILWLYGGFIFLYRALRANMRISVLFDKELKHSEEVNMGIARRIVLESKIRAENIDYERSVIWFAAIAMILAMNAIIMNYTSNLEKEVYGTLIANIFEIVALLWLIGASVFLFLVLQHSLTASKLREEHGISEGKIEYVDALDGASNMLVSEKYNLRGRPDYILEKEGTLIPVEVKTGRIPRGPLFSHILQLASYCLLMEEKYHNRPPHGIIKYGNQEHEIEYTKELKGILISKLDEMEKIYETGKTHRNHNRPNKCKGCSRKDICPERLV